jgi:hypothetical protein
MKDQLNKAIENYVKSKTRKELESHVAEEKYDWLQHYEDDELRKDFIKEWAEEIT